MEVEHGGAALEGLTKQGKRNAHGFSVKKRFHPSPTFSCRCPNHGDMLALLVQSIRNNPGRKSLKFRFFFASSGCVFSHASRGFLVLVF